MASFRQDLLAPVRAAIAAAGVVGLPPAQMQAAYRQRVGASRLQTYAAAPTYPGTPRFHLPFGQLDAALTRLDLLVQGAWAPRLDAIVARTRTFAYHGGFSSAGVKCVDGTLVIPSNGVWYVQRTAAGVVSADAALDLANKLPMAVVTVAGGSIVGLNDIRDIGPWATHALFTGAAGSIVVLGASGPVVLPPGDESDVLTMVAGSPAWAAGGGGGGVTLASVLSITEERPDTPSTYDDEFDATTIDAKWTQVLGSGSSYVLRNSRMLATAAVEFRQTFTITNPMRIQLGVTGYPQVANSSAWIDIQGATKGLRHQLYNGSTGGGRELWASRLSAAGAWETSLQTVATAPGGNQMVNTAVLTLIVDATNVVTFVGELGSARGFYSYARSNLGTLASVLFHLDPGWSVKFFRVDRAPSAYDFPLAWAG